MHRISGFWGVFYAFLLCSSGTGQDKIVQGSMARMFSLSFSLFVRFDAMYLPMQ